MKLKTLKDLYIQDEDELLRRIKAEAVKWILDCFICGTTPRKNCRACSRFKRFFNILEEDLK